MATVYRFKPWSRLSGDAQKVGEEIERIKEDAGGSVSGAALVAAAKNKSSVLHGYFEWADGKAAQKYREVQASHLLRSIIVVQSEGIEVKSPVRAFVSVQAAAKEGEEPDGDAGSYVSIADAVRIVSYREQMMKDALRDLDAYRMRYQLLSDLSGWGKALESARKFLERAILESQKEKDAA